MEPENKPNEAAERAERYAPKPTGGAWRAGLNGAVVALIGVYIVGSFYDVPLRISFLAAVPIVAIAYLVVYVGYRRARGRNRTAQADEMRRGNEVSGERRAPIGTIERLADENDDAPPIYSDMSPKGDLAELLRGEGREFVGGWPPYPRGGTGDAPDVGAPRSYKAPYGQKDPPTSLGENREQPDPPRVKRIKGDSD